MILFVEKKENSTRDTHAFRKEGGCAQTERKGAKAKTLSRPSSQGGGGVRRPLSWVHMDLLSCNWRPWKRGWEMSLSPNHTSGAWEPMDSQSSSGWAPTRLPLAPSPQRLMQQMKAMKSIWKRNSNTSSSPDYTTAMDFIYIDNCQGGLFGENPVKWRLQRWRVRLALGLTFWGCVLQRRDFPARVLQRCIPTLSLEWVPVFLLASLFPE